MSSNTTSNSPFHQIIALYTREPDSGTLNVIFGPGAPEIEATWTEKWRPALLKASQARLPVQDYYTFDFEEFDLDYYQKGNPGSRLQVFEKTVPLEGQVRGIIKVQSAGEDLFVHWFVELLLSSSCLAGLEKPSVADSHAFALASNITSIFSRTLRNVASNDRWESGGGRSYFETKVLLHTRRRLPIQFILPAFPCKSTSKEKVTGTRPDKGEELALRSLFKFVKEIETIYSPGAHVLVVSDGHVFSDCIGVDDDDVDQYGEQLIAMKNALLGSEAAKISFLGLKELFHVESLNSAALPQCNPHSPVETVHTPDADVCRKLLIATCGVSGSSLREKIESSDNATLALYRGFSKFMQEDLSGHAVMKDKGKNQRKKLASAVAFEMLLRNQAYSNLVELLYPAHLRLSIHCHDNSGPKFGIRLLDHATCRVVSSLTSDIREKYDDLLHIPTPWHNSLAKIHGEDGYVVVKSKVVKDAVACGEFTATWITSDAAAGTGGYFMLTPKIWRPSPPPNPARPYLKNLMQRVIRLLKGRYLKFLGRDTVKVAIVLSAVIWFYGVTVAEPS